MRKGSFISLLTVSMAVTASVVTTNCAFFKDLFGLGPVTLESVIITADTTTLIMSGSVQLEAKGIYSDSSDPTYLYDLTWSSSDESVVTIDTSLDAPQARGGKVGAATITGTKDGVSGSLSFAVVFPDFSEVFVHPTTTKSHTSDAAFDSNPQFLAIGVFSDSNEVAIDPYVDWASSNHDVATIDANGLVTPIGRGSTNITATFAPPSGSSVVSDLHQLNILWATEVSLNAPGTPDGTRVLMSGLFNSSATRIAVFSADAAFSGGALTDRLVKDLDFSFTPSPDTTTALINDGTYYLYVIVDHDGDGQITAADQGAIQSVDKTGNVMNTETVSTWSSLVNETVTISSSGLPDTATIFCFWLVPPTASINDYLMFDWVDYLVSGGSSGTIPSEYFRAWNSGTFAAGDVSAQVGIPLIPGTYDLDVFIDTDANNALNTGDYRFSVSSVSVDGSSTDITTAFLAATAHF